MCVTLYSNHCPCCEVLEEKLDAAGIRYKTETDPSKMLSAGMTHLPILCVDGTMMRYPAALTWLKERKDRHED